MENKGICANCKKADKCDGPKRPYTFLDCSSFIPDRKKKKEKKQ